MCMSHAPCLMTALSPLLPPPHRAQAGFRTRRRRVASRAARPSPASTHAQAPPPPTPTPATPRHPPSLPSLASHAPLPPTHCPLAAPAPMAERCTCTCTCMWYARAGGGCRWRAIPARSTCKLSRTAASRCVAAPVLRPQGSEVARGVALTRVRPLCACPQGDVERAAQQLLKDFRTGRLGRVCLELPPQVE